MSRLVTLGLGGVKSLLVTLGLGSAGVDIRERPRTAIVGYAGPRTAIVNVRA